MTRKELKQRLQAEGRWEKFVALRARLVADRLTPQEARREALRQLDACAPRHVAKTRGDAIAAEELYRPPSLCPRCERSGGMCGACQENEFQAYAAFCERRGHPRPCRWCYRKGLPACPTCFKEAGTVARLRAADFPREARYLEEWIERHENDGGAALADAQLEVTLRLPPNFLVDMRLVAKGMESQQWLADLKRTNPLGFARELRAAERDWRKMVEEQAEATQRTPEAQVDAGSQRVEELIERLLCQAADG